MLRNISPNKYRRAFTLIEVVISLAVVSLAIVAIMGLLGVFLQGTKAVIERNEALSICQALNTYLQEPDGTTQGFDKVYGWFSGGQTTIPQLYAFTLPVIPAIGTYVAGSGSLLKGYPEMQIVCPGGPGTKDTNFASYPNRVGRLYYINLELSQNVPYHVGVGRTIKTFTTSSTFSGISAYPAYTAGTGTCNDTTFYADSSLPLSVRIYAVPLPLSVSNGSTVGPLALQTLLENTNYNYPILMYDTVVNR